MTIIRFIGDTHGKTDLMTNHMLKSPDGISIHVGDVGIGWENDKNQQNKIFSAFNSLDNNNTFIRGNHDSLFQCKHHFKKWWRKDGSYDEKLQIMFMGGAYTINQHLYVEGHNWWRDEEMSYHYMNRVIDRYEKIKPRIVVSHDLPNCISTQMFFDININPTKTSRFFDRLLDRHKPELWFAGHWHTERNLEYQGTNYYVAPMNGYIDYNIGDLK